MSKPYVTSSNHTYQNVLGGIIKTINFVWMSTVVETIMVTTRLFIGRDDRFKL